MFDMLPFKWEDLLIILVIALIFFGPAKLPELGKALGKAIKGFRDGTKNITDEVKGEINQVKESISSSENDNTNTINKVN